MTGDGNKTGMDSLRSLRLEEEPPPAAERRILRELRAAGLVEPGRNIVGIGKGTAAALLLVGAFAAGWLAARTEPGRPPGNRYVLFLYGEPGARSTARVEEYRAWAREQREAGREVRGERLGASETTIGGSAPSGLTLQGFFVITAPGEPEALELAQRHPHVRHGGVVVVRPIDPT